MDEDYAPVRKVFCDWYHNGLDLSRQAHRELVLACTTAISDDEAEYMDEKGHLWHLRYLLTEPVSGQDYIVVATTRPETTLATRAWPSPRRTLRGAAFVGKTVKLPVSVVQSHL